MILNLFYIFPQNKTNELIPTLCCCDYRKFAAVKYTSSGLLNIVTDVQESDATEVEK